MSASPISPPPRLLVFLIRIFRISVAPCMKFTLLLPAVADSLAGRMETLSLLPLSQSEIELCVSNWLDCAFGGQLLQPGRPAIGPDLVERVLRGGYPEAVSRPSLRRRVVWARQYIDALVQRDVRDVEEVLTLHALPRLLRARGHTARPTCIYSQLRPRLRLSWTPACPSLRQF